MTNGQRSFSEPDLRRLLHDDVAPELTAEAHQRLRKRLGITETHKTISARRADATTFDTELDQELQFELHAFLALDETTSRRIRSAGILSVAATVVMVTLLSFLLLSSRSNNTETLVADDELVTPEPAGEAFCRDYAAPLAAAVDTWDGVENWSYLTDSRQPEPDLINLAKVALISLERIAPNERTATALAYLNAARTTEKAEPWTGLNLSFTRAERKAQRDAVDTALSAQNDTIIEMAWQSFEGCG